MKKIELNQMENLEGGLSKSCTLALISYGAVIVLGWPMTWGLGISMILASAGVVDGCLN